MQRTVILLLFTSIAIAFLWFNMKKTLMLCDQEEDIAAKAQSYILYSLPDLVAQSLLHPLRIYLRSQSVTLPFTLCAALSIIPHIPINYLLVSVFQLRIRGIAKMPPLCFVVFHQLLVPWWTFWYNVSFSFYLLRTKHLKITLFFLYLSIDGSNTRMLNSTNI
ncbi:hypothetical protein K1719_027106 [Acacia pycnantha]|nr:hypothetical protein K1719_035940 [Acacia pycnantha]KAI9093657.1 hypothetical protein K1719_027106 [Acacia pycnantha]